MKSSNISSIWSVPARPVILLKDSESSQIVAAIRAIYRGESLIHPSVASKILAEFSLMAQKKG